MRLAYSLLLLFMAALNSSCGGGGDVGANEDARSLIPVAPEILEATSINAGEIVLKWDISEPKVAYDIHAHADPEYTPSGANLIQSTKGVSQITLRNIEPKKPVFIKMVARSESGVTTAGKNTLQATAVSRSLKLNPDVIIRSTAGIGIRVIDMQLNKLTLDISQSTRELAIGDYIYGSTPSPQSEEFFAKIEKIFGDGSTRTVEVSIPRFYEIFSDGYASVAVSSRIEGQSSTLNSHNESRKDAVRRAAQGATCGGQLKIDFSTPTFAPTGGVEIGFLDEGPGFVRAWANARATSSGSLNPESTLSGTVTCSLPLIESAPFMVRLPFAFPIFVGIKPAVKLVASVSSNGGLGGVLGGVVDGYLNAAVTLFEHKSPDFSFDGSLLKGDFRPAFSARPANPSSLTATAGVNFGVDALVTFATRSEFLSVTVGKISISHDLTSTIESESTPGFIRRNNIQAVQLKNLNATEGVNLNLFFGADIKISDLIRTSLGLNKQIPIAGPSTLFSTFEPKLSITEIVSADEKSTQGIAEVAAFGGVFTDIDTSKTTWHFYPTPPDSVKPDPINGQTSINYFSSTEGCVASSVTDQVTREFGRRFSRIKLYGQSIQTVLDFDKNNIKHSAGKYVLEFKDNFGVTHVLNYQDGVKFPDNKLLTINPHEELIIRRSDGMAFDLGQFSIGVAVLTDPDRENLISVKVSGERFASTVSKDYPLSDGAGTREIVQMPLDTNIFRGLATARIKLITKYPDQSRFSLAALFIDDIYMRLNCEE